MTSESISGSGLAGLSRAQLAKLGREYMLVGQFNSRTGYAALAMNHGQEAYKDTAIDNWMAASPVYARRMQKAMRLKSSAGLESDVGSILKGMQLECGLSHQYFDARFELVSADEGFFWLQSCGPLLETEPRGEAAVKVMCHDIEDPTFDATAAASNPRARVRPIHRPPRAQTGESATHKPVCRWRVFVDPAAKPLPDPEVAQSVYKTQLANTVIERGPVAEQGGLDYYDGPVLEKLELERFSHQALVVICKELGIQIHLLIHALGLAVEKRFGADAVADIAEFQMTGTCWVASERLVESLGGSLSNSANGIDAIIDVLRVHPAFQPEEYITATISKTSENSATLELHNCAAADDGEVHSWFKLLESGRDAGVAAMVQGVNSLAQVTAEEASAKQGSLLKYSIVLDPDAEPVEPPLAVQVAKGTQLYNTKLVDSIELLDITP